MKNILITGGAGFIGSNLALKLSSLGYNVTVLDNLSEQVHGSDPSFTSPLFHSIDGKVSFILGSVTNAVDWTKALKGQDCIVHLAAETGTGQSMYEIKKYTDINVGGTALMLDILTNSKHKVKKVVIASSRSIYGEGRYFCEELNQHVFPEARKEEDMLKGNFECSIPGCEKLTLVGTTEDSLIHPSSIYGITKQVQEQMVMVVCPTIGIESVALRFQNVYGAGQSLTNPYTGILSIFSNRIRNGNSINIFEDGKESRDFIYIDDVVDGIVLSILNTKANRKIFNIGTGIPIDVLTVAQTLIKEYRSNTEIFVSGNYRVGDIRHNYADISLARKVLDFNPKWDFISGIKRFAEWVNEQRTVEDRYDDSIAEMKSKGLYK